MLILLGPQRFHPNLRRAVESLDVAGSVAVITAGWQERESEDDELAEHLGREVVDLMLYHRYEDVLAADAPLAAALGERQESLREMQTLYRVRLSHTLEAARELMRREGRGPILEDQRRAAIRAVRALDREHLRRLRRIHEAFEENWTPAERPAVRAERDKLRRTIESCAVLAVAGGHVSVLVNRLRLFGLADLAAGAPVVAWSAGAMALTERIALFHDSPPQGPGDPEILDCGLAMCRKIVALPHARRRLQLDDPVRVALFARRFSPATCVILDEAADMRWNGERWWAARGTLRLTRGGKLRAIAR